MFQRLCSSRFCAGVGDPTLLLFYDALLFDASCMPFDIGGGDTQQPLIAKNRVRRVFVDASRECRF